MKARVLTCYFLLAICTSICYSQSTTDKSKITVYLRSGVTQQTTTDHLLNYYDYSGKTMIPLNLDVFYFNKQHLFVLNLLHESATLYPDNTHNNYYEYNYIHHRATELKLEYFYTVAKDNGYISAHAGISNNSHIVVQEENYKSLLSNSAEGYRKSYDLSALSMSPALLVNIHIQKSTLLLKGACSLLNLATRPDDDFVKQLGLANTFHWKWYSPTEYKSVFFSAMYQYQIAHGLGFTAEFNVLYRTYSTDDYQYLRHSFLIGISKTFQR